MLELVKIAITGGLASGKTTVCNILAAHGAYVVSADAIVHKLLSPNTQIGKQILDQFGSEILEGNTFNREKIAALVFANPEKLLRLEKLIHPAVMAEIRNQFQAIKQKPQYRFFVAEIPLLYEIAGEDFFNIVIAVMADEKLCQKRYQKLTGRLPEEWQRRMARQLPQKEKTAKAHFTIMNNGSIAELEESVIHLLKEISIT